MFLVYLALVVLILSLSGIVFLTVKAKKRSRKNISKKETSSEKKKIKERKELSSKKKKVNKKPSLEDDFWDKIS